ncbi:MAG: transcription termination/antitermination protein NusG [Bacilli bacterium]|jgi:transcriptional antiterminator NusG|nr:transcription termination/antitermination protein NusG [Bacilli bacterium]
MNEDVVLNDNLEDEELVDNNEKKDRKWYVVTTYSGYENKVKEYLELRTESMGLTDLIENIIVPEVEEKTAEGKIKMKKLFPGYVLIQMEITDEAWFIVRNTPNVTGFVGSSGKGAKPIPLSDEEVKDIFFQMGLSEISVDFEVGDMVQVTKGPFENEVGPVTSMDLKAGKVEVIINILGRETPIEINANELRKM